MPMPTIFRSASPTQSPVGACRRCYPCEDDCLHGAVRQIVRYGYDNQVVSISYAIEHADEVIRAPTQTGFEWNDNQP
jgi:hypothetical protein